LRNLFRFVDPSECCRPGFVVHFSYCISENRFTGDRVMGPSHWYELRVLGSAGTSCEVKDGVSVGIAIAENGRLCSIASGAAKCFESEQAATDYLFTATIPGKYRFEAVRCESPAIAA
jgi:hypothetical protein